MTLTCPECGGEMHRVPEVIDCWFDSGSMPFAQWHYPFENQDKFEENFPADFISEAVDQTRGWFYTLLAISTLLFDKAPFKNCIVLGHVQDEDGKKMSKHIGNVVDPWDVLDKQGADAVRWYFYTAAAPWLPSRFYRRSWCARCQRKFMGTLWNTYAFFTLYASIDHVRPAKHEGRGRGPHADGQVGAVQAHSRWSSPWTRTLTSYHDHRSRPRASPTLWTNCPTGTCAAAASASGARAWRATSWPRSTTLYTVLDHL